jgi:hypothetical protein
LKFIETELCAAKIVESKLVISNNLLREKLKQVKQAAEDVATELEKDASERETIIDELL